MREPDPNLTENEARVLADIGEYGVHIVHVLEGDQGHGFSYTVGLTCSFEHPEVIVFGLPEQIAHELLNAIADNASNGAQYVAGATADDLLHGYPVRMLGVAADDHGDYLGLAQWAYEGAEFEVVQLVYPDKQGRWPWDDSASKGFQDAQPVVGRRESSQ